MRAKLGGRYAKYAKASNSPEKSENRITNGRNSQDVGIFQKSFNKKEVTIGDEGNILIVFSVLAYYKGITQIQNTPYY